jgi:hypothetical protein
MREHELGGPSLRLAERLLGDRCTCGCDKQGFEHIEGRVEEAVACGRVVADVAIRAAVVELGLEHRPAQWLEPRIAVEEVRTEPEPESEVAEIDPLERGRPSTFSPRGMKRPRRRSMGTTAAG